MATYYTTDFEGMWVGVAAVVEAETEDQARHLLDIQIRAMHEKYRAAGAKIGSEPLDYTIQRLEPMTAIVLQDGDY